MTSPFAKSKRNKVFKKYVEYTKKTTKTPKANNVGKIGDVLLNISNGITAIIGASLVLLELD